jgi:tripartite-type tricarboxylate transporter receptor subunit TctC
MGFNALRSAAWALAFAAVSLNTAANAEDYPTRPITIVVTLAAGTGMDVIARLYAEKLHTEMKRDKEMQEKLPTLA